MTTTKKNESYPYLRIAREFSLPYDVVLLLADRLRGQRNHDEYWTEWAYDRWRELMPSCKTQVNFVEAMLEAKADFERIQREGW